MKFFDLTLIVPSNSDKNSFNFFLENMTTIGFYQERLYLLLPQSLKLD